MARLRDAFCFEKPVRTFFRACGLWSAVIDAILDLPRDRAAS
ncbi:hypothetical protein [Streptomyces liangshanensis]|nr:hypothetical protein [Streptomyces liangshanensis]